MRNENIAKRAQEIAKKYRTMYLYNTAGDPITDEVKAQHRFEYHHGKKRKALEAADESTFAFDNTGFIAALLTGWEDPKAKRQKNKAHGLPKNIMTMKADDLIESCNKISDKFDYVQPGELLWTSGCVGLYIGDGLCVACIESFGDGVQIIGMSQMDNDGKHPQMYWKKHGMLPWIDYVGVIMKSYIKVAEEVRLGKWGADRNEVKERLIEQGYNANLILSHMDKKFLENMGKTNLQIAAGVLIGKWGTTTREQNTRLKLAGYNVNAIRQAVNRIKRGDVWKATNQIKSGDI